MLGTCQHAHRIPMMYTSKCLPNPAGGRATYYRILTLLFTNMDKLQTLMASPEGQSIIADHENFATGGHMFLLGCRRPATGPNRREDCNRDRLIGVRLGGCRGAQTA